VSRGAALRKAGAVVFVGAAFLFLGIALAGQREELLAHGWRFRPLPLVASLLVLIAALAASAGIWRATLRHLGADVPLPVLLRIWFLSSLGRYIPGKVWQFVGVAELSRVATIPVIAAVTSLVLYMGLIVLAAWIIGIYLLPPALLGPLGAVVWPARLLTPLLLVSLHPSLLGPLVGWTARLTRQPLTIWSASWGSALWLLLLALLQWAAFGVAFSLFVASLTPIGLADVPALTAAFALSFLAGYLVIIAPAGLGAKEGALALLLAGSATVSGVAILVAIGARVWLIVGEVLPALVLLRGTGARTEAATTPETP
jgi:glycosyltransferase 2 family protein